jgi:hypothetical protein
MGLMNMPRNQGPNSLRRLEPTMGLLTISAPVMYRGLDREFKEKTYMGSENPRLTPSVYKIMPGTLAFRYNRNHNGNPGAVFRPGSYHMDRRKITGEVFTTISGKNMDDEYCFAGVTLTEHVAPKAAEKCTLVIGGKIDIINTTGRPVAGGQILAARAPRSSAEWQQMPRNSIVSDTVPFTQFVLEKIPFDFSNQTGLRKMFGKFQKRMMSLSSGRDLNMAELCSFAENNQPFSNSFSKACQVKYYVFSQQKTYHKFDYFRRCVVMDAMLLSQTPLDMGTPSPEWGDATLGLYLSMIRLMWTTRIVDNEVNVAGVPKALLIDTVCSLIQDVLSMAERNMHLSSTYGKYEIIGEIMGDTPAGGTMSVLLGPRY